MGHSIKGTFDIARTVQPAVDLGGLSIGRMRFEKTFHGELTAGSQVEMMGYMREGVGSGAYVALEHVTGTLGGRQGSFMLQHSCAMDRGKQQQSITVVPDSGTAALAGLGGTMTIDIVSGQHFYTFVYTIAD